jgi:hypothetical protein
MVQAAESPSLTTVGDGASISITRNVAIYQSEITRPTQTNSYVTHLSVKLERLRISHVECSKCTDA